MLVAWPVRENSSAKCSICQSFRSTSRTDFFLGLVPWRVETTVRESVLFADGLLDSTHQHVWSFLHRSSRGVLRCTDSCGGSQIPRRFVAEYASDPTFRNEVQASLSRGTLTLAQVRSEVEGTLTASDPGSTAIEEILQRFGRFAELSR